MKNLILILFLIIGCNGSEGTSSTSCSPKSVFNNWRSDTSGLYYDMANATIDDVVIIDDWANGCVDGEGDFKVAVKSSTLIEFYMCNGDPLNNASYVVGCTELVLRFPDNSIERLR